MFLTLKIITRAREKNWAKSSFWLQLLPVKVIFTFFKLSLAQHQQQLPRQQQRQHHGIHSPCMGLEGSGFGVYGGFKQKLFEIWQHKKT